MEKAFIKYILVISLSILVACGKEETSPEPIKTPEQQAVESLAGKSSTRYYIGNTGTVTKNGNAQTHFYKDFEIRFASSGETRTYTTANADFTFENSGTWSFVGDNFQKIILSGSKPASNREIFYTRTDKELHMQFTIDPPVAARVNAITGSYQIRMNVR